MSIRYRSINEELPNGQGNTIAELKNRLFARRSNHESIVYYAVLRILHRIRGESGRVLQLEDLSPGLTKGKGWLQRSYTYEEARNHWLDLKLIREFMPEEYDKFYE